MTLLGGRFKLIQVSFARGDGSVFVSFPYYRARAGIVSRVALRSNNTAVDLKPRGKVTSHLVKYSHHPDGRAHFSQDRKVFTHVSRRAVPLDEVGGHLFTAHVTGFEQFEPLSAIDAAKSPATNRTVLNFAFGLERPPGIKIVGRLHTAESLRIDRIPPQEPGPIWTVDAAGGHRQVFLVAPPVGRIGSQRIIMLSAEPWLGSDSPDRPHLSFIGGFDRPAVVLDRSQRSELLALAYPLDDADELRRQLGSIDFS
jgi:hypothetical protein